MTRIVFLDIDGVLNNRTSSFLGTKKVHPPGNICMHTMDRGCVLLFKVLLMETDSRFVISSSWRGRNLEQSEPVFKALAWCGFEDAKNFCLGQTPRLPSGFRSDEIQHWLNEFGQASKVVTLDDDSFDIRDEHNLVHCEGEIGLTVKDVMKAKSILLGEADVEKIY